MRTLIVLPSYNESLNILQLIEALLNLSPDNFVCVVDDSSPDGTPDKINTYLRDHPSTAARVHLIVRSKKDGRGGAVRDGFRWGFQQRPDFHRFVEMDCDFSHRPDEIGKGLSLLKDPVDVVLGVRYPDGIIIDWPMSRRVFSFFANMLARLLIRWSIPDYTNGFRFYSRKSASVLLSYPQHHRGYIYLSESLTYLMQEGCKIAYFPTIFKNRKRGVSNTSLREISDALTGLVAIAWHYRLAPYRPHDSL